MTETHENPGCHNNLASDITFLLGQKLGGNNIVKELNYASRLLENAAYDLAGELDAARVGTLMNTSASLQTLAGSLARLCSLYANENRHISDLK